MNESKEQLRGILEDMPQSIGVLNGWLIDNGFEEGASSIQTAITQYVDFMHGAPESDNTALRKHCLVIRNHLVRVFNFIYSVIPDEDLLSHLHGKIFFESARIQLLPIVSSMLKVSPRYLLVCLIRLEEILKFPEKPIDTGLLYHWTRMVIERLPHHCKQIHQLNVLLAMF